MRFRHRDGTLVHVAYCTNVHPAEDLDGVLAQLATYAAPVRERLGLDRLGVGLWLARPVAAGLAADRAAVDRLRHELTARGLEVVTLNGFPYRGFHAPVVKRAVYSPDWTEAERLDYTVDLARVLARLLPDDAARGSVSTLPLAWREPWSTAREAAALDRLTALGKELAGLDRPVRVALEPEPGCVVETTGQLRRVLDRLDPERIGGCLDACHLAVGFEDPVAAVAAAAPVVKTQVSCALEAADPADPRTRRALATFAESRFLHQTRSAGGRRWDDLDAALAGGQDGGDEPAAADPWRVHFHVPLHADPAPPLASTRGVLVGTLGALLGGASALTDHLEVETYTWQVLPPGLAAELAWTARQLTALGLTEVPS
jgi:sugar phosphate isomerase/epimerase